MCLRDGLETAGRRPRPAHHFYGAMHLATERIDPLDACDTGRRAKAQSPAEPTAGIRPLQDEPLLPVEIAGEPGMALAMPAPASYKPVRVQGTRRII